jgi:diacylglycerol O-acyltransferase
MAAFAGEQHGMAPRSRLTSLDGSFLRLETPSAHMHVAWKGRFAPRADGQPVTLEALRAHVAARLCNAPRFRQRLARPPAGLGEPVWVDDERFAIEDHVIAFSSAHAAVSRTRFDALCDLFLSEPLDRGSALWCLAIAPRLDDGTVGLAMKVHHAMVDGMSAVELVLLLLDLEPEPRAPELEEWTPARAPGTAQLALEALAERGEASVRTAKRLARLARHPRRTARRGAATLRDTAVAVGGDLLRAAPESHVNAKIGPRRTLVHHTTALEPLLQARKRFGVTLNDVVLAAVSGALREHCGQPGRIPQPLKAMVPVNTRPAAEAAALGNRISFVFVDLPIDRAGAQERLAAVHAATARFKREHRAEAGETVLGAIGLLPDPLKDAMARLAGSPRTYNLTISNVPGPRVPVYLLGCELREAVPVIPLSDGHALSVGIFTYRDRATFGFYADPTALPDVRALPALLEAELEQLCKRPAGAGPERTRRHTRAARRTEAVPATSPGR